MGKFYQRLSIERDKDDKHIDEKSIIEKIAERNIQWLIKGDIGSGKSTFAKYLCYEWAKKENAILNSYRLVIYLKLRNLDENTKNISDLVHIQYRGLVNNFNVNEFIFEYQDEILFIFDGLDELKNQKCRENFYRINQFLENTIIFSRTNSININRLYLNDIFCIKGFKDIYKINEIYSTRDLNKLKEKERIIRYLLRLIKIKTWIFENILLSSG